MYSTAYDSPQKKFKLSVANNSRFFKRSFKNTVINLLGHSTTCENNSDINKVFSNNQSVIEFEKDYRRIRLDSGGTNINQSVIEFEKDYQLKIVRNSDFFEPEANMSVLLGMGIYKTYEDAKKVYEGAKKDNWDGYGAAAIAKEQYDFAVKFIKKLFEYRLDLNILHLLEMTPENYGNIAFDWFVNHDRQISVSIRNGKALFNYKFDDEKMYGEIPLDKDLNTIMNLIKKLYD